MDFIIYNGQTLLCKDIVMKELNLFNGQTVSESVMWKAISLNATYGLAEIAIQKAKDKVTHTLPRDTL